jgi:AraC-like DNA-binding protein
METAKLLFFGVAIGAVIAGALGILRAPRPAVRLSGLIFFLAVAAYAGVVAQFTPGQLRTPQLGPVAVLNFPLRLLSVGTVGWFWLFVQTLFEDAEVRPTQLAVIGVLSAIGLFAVYSPPDISQWVWVVANVINAGLLIHAMLIVWRGWTSDLVETRRRLRGPFLMTVSIYTLVMRPVEVWATFNHNPAWYLAFNAATLAFICLAATWAFLLPAPDLFGAAAPAKQPDNADKAALDRARPERATPDRAALDRAALDRAALADLARLDALMKAQQVWREEGLTIASLAVRANMPEAHLRRLINDQLGYRNFPSFVNRHRIEAAKAKLADPNEARTSISAVAFDIGFASLGPFNRAFREETGQSPSEWRRAALGQPSREAGALLAYPVTQRARARLCPAPPSVIRRTKKIPRA